MGKPLVVPGIASKAGARTRKMSATWDRASACLREIDAICRSPDVLRHDAEYCFMNEKYRDHHQATARLA